jgi:hypothetical protein
VSCWLTDDTAGACRSCRTAYAWPRGSRGSSGSSGCRARKASRPFPGCYARKTLTSRIGERRRRSHPLPVRWPLNSLSQDGVEVALKAFFCNSHRNSWPIYRRGQHCRPLARFW